MSTSTASNTASAAHAAAVARKAALHAIIDAFQALDDAALSPALTDADRADIGAVVASVQSPWILTLKKIRGLLGEIDSLEDAALEAAAVLNAAPEEAA